jgi:hypothetical protein
MSRSDRFQQHEDEIAGLTGNTPNFDTDAEVREYFTRKNIKEMFPGERVPSQSELNDYADLVIEFKATSASGMWSKAAQRKMAAEGWAPARSMRRLIEGLQRVMEEKETYLVIKKGKDGTLFLTGTKWSPEYPDAMIFNTISKAEKAAKQYGGEALSKTDFDEDNY